MPRMTSEEFRALQERMAKNKKGATITELTPGLPSAIEINKGGLSPIKTNLRISPTTDEMGLNKTERARLQFLECLRYPFIGVHSMTLKLGHDTRYTADFWYVDPNGEIILEDVKGHMEDDARVKIYTCARLYRMFKFLIVKKSKTGWDVTEVKP